MKVKRRALFTSSPPAWHAAKPVVGDVSQHKGAEDYEHQG